MILVTGANGFVGSTVCRALFERGRPVRACVRASRVSRESKPTKPTKPQDQVLGLQAHEHLHVTDGVTTCIAPDLGQSTDPSEWTKHLVGCHTVVHTAAMAHVMSPSAADIEQFHHVNVSGTLMLARLAYEAGVRRFVFMSTVKVHGERTLPGQPFTADQPRVPSDPYARSKQQAEEGLMALAQQTGLELVIIRPPLVYGPGVSGNLEVLMRWMRRGVPLPVGAITDNARSLVGVDNLVDLIITTIDHPNAANRQFLVSDDHDLSTLSLVQQLGRAGHIPVRTLALPQPLLRLLARLVGRSHYLDRLTENLQVNIEATKESLGWQPPLSVAQSMARLFEHETVSKRANADL